jgi:hypothetical protein
MTTILRAIALASSAGGLLAACAAPDYAYSPPQTTVVAPAATYVTPAPTMVLAPTTTYVAPAPTTYAMPTATYVAPSPAYLTPTYVVPTYVTPAYVTPTTVVAGVVTTPVPRHPGNSPITENQDVRGSGGTAN